MATGADLATRFEAANSELIAAVEQLSEAQWMQTSPEGWTVGVAAHHVAEDHGILTGYVGAVANGQPVPPLTMDGLNAMNAEHAKRAAGCTKAETLQLLRDGGEQAATMLRGLGSDQLAKKVHMPMANGDMSAEQIAEGIMIGHINMHIAGVKAALGQ